MLNTNAATELDCCQQSSQKHKAAAWAALHGGVINCTFPLSAVSPTDLCETPRKEQSIRVAASVCELWACFLFVWHDYELHLLATVSKQLQVQINGMKNWNLCSSVFLYRECWIWGSL